MRPAAFLSALALGMGGVAAVGLAGCTQADDPEALARALGGRRLIEPRLTGGFAHAPCQAQPDPGGRLVPRLLCSAPPAGADRVEIFRLVHRHPKGEAAALALLLLEEEKTDQAVRQLERRAQTENARALSNLGAAYLVRAQRQDEPRDLLKALAVLDRAVAADATLPEACFNRALALENLFLTAEAQQAWRACLALDPASDWAREARHRLAALTAAGPGASWEQRRSQLEAAISQGRWETLDRLVARSRQEAREEAEQRLGDWAEAAAQGLSVQAAEALRFSRAIGESLDRIGGDRLVRDAVAAIDAAGRSGNPALLQSLLQGHREYQAARRIHSGRQTDPDRAAVRFAAAARFLTLGKSPYAARASYYAASSTTKRGLYTDSLGSLATLEKGLGGRRYPNLLGSIQLLKGLNQVILGRVAESILAYSQAEEQFRAAGESENADTAQGLAAENLRWLGESAGAWRALYRFLRRTPDLRDPENLFLAFVLPADQLLEEGEPALALHFQNAVVEHAGRSANPSLIGDAYFWRALMYQRLDRLEEARADLRQARPVLETLEESDFKQRLLADLERIEGEVLGEAEPARAAEALQSALQLYEKKQHHLLALLTYRSLARVYRRLGDMPRAEATLRKGLLAHTNLGEGVTQEELKLSLLERTAEAFDEMITFQVDVQKRPDLAFVYADLARTRALPAIRPGEGPGRNSDLVTAEEIGLRLPERTALLEYSVSDGRLLAWMLRNGEWQFHEETFTPAELTARIEDLRSSTQISREHWLRASRALFELLIRRFRPHLSPGDRLLLVPDKRLHAIPFAALQDARTGRFLIEDFEIAYVPSAALLREPRARASAPVSLLAVGNPTLDRSFPPFTGLRDLPGAQREAETVAALVPNSRRLTADAAQRSAFLALAPQARWLHVASHGLANRRDPLLSMLAFGPDGSGDSGALFAREIAALDLPRTELAVLSACDTGPQPMSGSGGHSLARAFLAAGVPTVVANFEVINEKRFGREIEQLFQTFYRRLIAGDDPVSALRAAQREHLTADPAVWGSFGVFTVRSQRS